MTDNKSVDKRETAGGGLPSHFTAGFWLMTHTTIWQGILKAFPEPIEVLYLSESDEHNARLALAQGSSGKWFLHDETDSGLTYRAWDTLTAAKSYLRRLR
jgi:hypothetical protein